ncbi:hypothetical protein COOONC_14050, partial [Cooperia oncophora]
LPKIFSFRNTRNFPARHAAFGSRKLTQTFELAVFRVVPQLCLDDYHLRYTNGFIGRSNEFGPPVGSQMPALMSDGERGSNLSPKNGSFNEEHRNSTRERPKGQRLERPSENSARSGSTSANSPRHGTKPDSTRSAKSSPDNFAVTSVPTRSSHARDSEGDLQDITASGSVGTVPTQESIKMTVPISAKTFSPPVPNKQRILNTTVKPNVGLTPAPKEHKGEKEVILDLDDHVKKNKDIMVAKRRDPSFLSGPLQPHRRFLQQRHRKIAGECETNPFWMRIKCAKTCGTCDCSCMYRKDFV